MITFIIYNYLSINFLNSTVEFYFKLHLLHSLFYIFIIYFSLYTLNLIFSYYFLIFSNLLLKSFLWYTILCIIFSNFCIEPYIKVLITIFNSPLNFFSIFYLNFSSYINKILMSFVIFKFSIDDYIFVEIFSPLNLIYTNCCSFMQFTYLPCSLF